MSGIATLAYGLIAAGSAKASSYQAGYPAGNALLGKVNRPWRSLTLGSDWLQIDFGTSVNLALLAINGVNMQSADIYADDFSTPLSLRGTIQTGTDKQGRAKGSLLFPAAAATVTHAPITAGPLGAGWSVPVLSTSGFVQGEWVRVTDGTNVIEAVVAFASSGLITLSGVDDRVTGSATSMGIGAQVITLPCRYLRIQNLSGHLDEQNFWKIASVFAFANLLTLARDPLFGESSNDLNHPQARADLDNGVTIADSTGPSFMTPTLQFSGSASDDHEQIARLAKAGLCWLNLNDGNVGDQWPVRHYEPKTTRKFAGFNRETVSIPLKEYTGGA